MGVLKIIILLSILSSCGEALIRRLRAHMKLSVLSSTFSVCRLPPDTPGIPDWVRRDLFWTVTRTSDELSIVCAAEGVPAVDISGISDVLGLKVESGWRIIRVEGPLDFSLTGILASIANPLAQAKISIFAISTFDTDYVLVREEKLTAAREALVGAGFVLD
jgi:hypothetical protein